MSCICTTKSMGCLDCTANEMIVLLTVDFFKVENRDGATLHGKMSK